MSIYQEIAELLLMMEDAEQDFLSVAAALEANERWRTAADPKDVLMVQVRNLKRGGDELQKSLQLQHERLVEVRDMLRESVSNIRGGAETRRVMLRRLES